VTEPRLLELPTEGIWRLGRAPDPLEWRPPSEPVDTATPGAGNRFDSFHGNYSTLYFGTTPEACYLETLARFRPSPAMRDVVANEWAERGYMDVGSVPADWRDSRILVNAGIEEPRPFVDAAAADTIAAFRADPRVMPYLQNWGVDQLDLSHIVGSDRRVTRLLSQWAWDRELKGDGVGYDGIRYVSRLGSDRECWVVFEGVPLVEISRRPVLHTDTVLCAVAQQFGLVVH
jgi:hypothetical protein